MWLLIPRPTISSPIFIPPSSRPLRSHTRMVRAIITRAAPLGPSAAALQCGTTVLHRHGTYSIAQLGAPVWVCFGTIVNTQLPPNYLLTVTSNLNMAASRTSRRCSAGHDCTLHHTQAKAKQAHVASKFRHNTTPSCARTAHRATDPLVGCRGDCPTTPNGSRLLLLPLLQRLQPPPPVAVAAARTTP